MSWRKGFSGRGRVLYLKEDGPRAKGRLGMVHELLELNCRLVAEDRGFATMSCGGVPSHLVAFVPDDLIAEVIVVVKKWSPYKARKLEQQINQE